MDDSGQVVERRLRVDPARRVLSTPVSGRFSLARYSQIRKMIDNDNVPCSYFNFYDKGQYLRRSKVR